jgi:hypothetical protein
LFEIVWIIETSLEMIETPKTRIQNKALNEDAQTFSETFALKNRASYSDKIVCLQDSI